MSTYGKNNRWKEGVRCQTYFFFEGGTNNSIHIIIISMGGKDKKSMNDSQQQPKGRIGIMEYMFFFILQNPKKKLQDQNSRWD